jgi:hypothetical protein
MKAATIDQEQMQRHLDAHLRCAARNPRKRQQHISSARYYAQLLGIEMPRLSRPPFTAESWVQRNPRLFFVLTEDRPRRCSLCGKHIASGEQYLGMHEINIDRLIRSGVTSIRKARAKRLHHACAESIN